MIFFPLVVFNALATRCVIKKLDVEQRYRNISLVHVVGCTVTGTAALLC